MNATLFKEGKMTNSGTIHHVLDICYSYTSTWGRYSIIFIIFSTDFTLNLSHSRLVCAQILELKLDRQCMIKVQ